MYVKYKNSVCNIYYFQYKSQTPNRKPNNILYMIYIIYNILYIIYFQNSQHENYSNSNLSAWLYISQACGSDQIFYEHKPRHALKARPVRVLIL